MHLEIILYFWRGVPKEGGFLFRPIVLSRYNFSVARKELDELALEDIIRLLQERPDLRERLREVLLTEEERQIASQIPQLVETTRELSQSVRQGFERQERLEATVAELSETVRELSQSVRQGFERQERLEATVADLSKTVASLSETVRDLSEKVAYLLTTVADLSKTVASLSETVRDLSEKVAYLLTTVADLSTKMAGLSETVASLSATVSGLVTTVSALQASQQDAIARIERLEGIAERLIAVSQESVERLDRLERIVADLVEWSKYAKDDLAKLKGMALETQYLNRAPAVFGYYVNRPRVLNVGQFLDGLRRQGHTFTQEQWQQLAEIDVLLSARHPQTDAPIYIVVEVSWMLYPDDVERIYQRAEILRALGLEVYPAVAGEGVYPQANELAERYKVLLLLDGRLTAWGLFA